MGSIDMGGTLEWLQLRLVWIHQVIRERMTGGWPLFQDDEVWVFKTEEDDFVCPFCLHFESQNPWSGSEILHFFPEYEIISTRSGGVYETPIILAPHIHKMLEYFDEESECRCRITMHDSAEMLEARLHMDKLEVLIG